MNERIDNSTQFKEEVQHAFGSTEDFVLKAIEIGSKDGFLCYLTSMTDSSLITDKILDPLHLHSVTINNETTLESIAQQLFAGTTYATHIQKDDLFSEILSGNVLICLEGFKSFISVKIGINEKRSIEEPSTQTIIRGPKEGFVEDVGTNISLLRKKIKNTSLRFESFTIGDDTATSVYLSYINSIANPKIVSEVRKRVEDIKTNTVLDSSTIEEYITDKTLTPFPLIYNSERPDIIAADLTEGKVAILVDGSPFVLTMPCTLNDFMSMSEDYYHQFMMGTLVRVLRYFALIISLFLPSIYVAIITFHHEMLPTPLLISVISQREAIPFPAVVEALLMEITFEILREAGVRMPRAVGGTISIVGGLVIGQAAVEAGLVSNFMVIVVALTAISSFVSPVYSFASAPRILRFVVILAAAIFGLYGVILFMIILVGHLASLRSFGVGYLAPVAPISVKDQKDIFFRAPAWLMSKKPTYLKTKQQDSSNNREGGTT